LAALFLRAFFLRDFFAMTGCLPFGQVLPRSGVDPMMLVRRVHVPDGPPRGWIPSQAHAPTREGGIVADEIRAEMVANVWKVVVSTGDSVSEGDTLVILESMKMEIPVVAESDGVVERLAVNEGDVVSDGDLIAVIG
jgi:biotin carboxyl carrier protein